MPIPDTSFSRLPTGQAEEQTELLRSIEHLVAKSERLRATAVAMVAGLLAVIASVVAFLPRALPKGQEETFRPAIFTMILILGGTAAYQMSILWLMRRWHHRSASLIRVAKFINAFVEILVPSLVMWNWAHVAGVIPTVGGVLPWLYFPFIAASALHLNPRLCWFTGAIAAVAFVTVSRLILRTDPSIEESILTSTTSFVLKGCILVIAGGVAAFVSSQLRGHLVRAVELARERDRAVNIFGQHVSPQVARRLIEQRTSMNAEQRHVCVLFLDIRGFSNIAASHTPGEVMEYLNTLFTPMIAIVNQHGGIVNKFLGDGFMAIFGAPFEDPALHRNAVECSIKLLACVEQLNASKSIYPTKIGIGIHAGSAMAGTVGSDERKEYTLLGDTVNAAARIEQETKARGAQILASSIVVDGLSELGVVWTDMGEVNLRGISQPLKLCRLA
ncbi:MAG: adenylate/guanylate cyclase domain-containing protein [Verrucomicrobiaceae bacterium]|nr:adenylate/guanylate cyclase domain-containing protein [Verrucomicrobiaceae bacterium]